LIQSADELGEKAFPRLNNRLQNSLSVGQYGDIMGFENYFIGSKKQNIKIFSELF
jgi:hypothetical protein